MIRRMIIAAAVMGSIPAISEAQRPSPTGYFIVRIKTAATSSGPAQPGPGGAEGYPGGLPGGDPAGSPGGFPGGSPSIDAGGAGAGFGPMPPMGSGSGMTPPPTGQPQGDPNQSVIALTHYRRVETNLVYPRNRPSEANPPQYKWFTNYGTVFLYFDNRDVEFYRLPGDLDFQQRVLKTAIRWTNKESPADEGMELIDQALQNNMVEEAYKYAGQLIKAVEAKKDQAQPAPITKFIAAFKAMEPKVMGGALDTGEAERWRDRLRAVQVDQSAHYALVNWGDQSVGPKIISQRLELLEKNFKAFFLWHALQGVTLPVPDAKMTVVLAEKVGTMNRLHDAFNGSPIVSDAFYSARHQVLVLSPERTDQVGRNFERIVESKFRRGWNRADLLEGKGPLLDKGETILPVMEAMTFALVDTAVESTAAQAMISREGSRQLFSACGLLPQYVVLPDWVQGGASNLFYQPKSPLYTHVTEETPTMVVALNAGYGSPNFVFHRQFLEMHAKKELQQDPVELLMNVLNDRYFDAMREGADIDPKPEPKPEDKGIKLGGKGNPMNPAFPMGGGLIPGGSPSLSPGGPMPPDGGGAVFPGEGGYPPGGPGGMIPGQQTPPVKSPEQLQRELLETLETKSQATSWALLFYLSKRKLPELLAFYQELSRMPRDMRIDRGLVVHAFCKHFGLSDPNSPTGYNQDAAQRFAQGWIEFMRSYPKAGYEVKMNLKPIGGDSSSTPGGGANPMFPMPGGAGVAP